MEYTVIYATNKELNSWMELVDQVSWNFPGLETKELMSEYKNTVIKNINRKSAICAVSENKVIGILLFSIKYNMICCLAVHPDYRKKGIAKQMISETLNNLDNRSDIIVETFCEDDSKGIAPRALYTSLGFEPAEVVENFGYPHQRFILHAKKK